MLSIEAEQGVRATYHVVGCPLTTLGEVVAALCRPGSLGEPASRG